MNKPTFLRTSFKAPEPVQKLLKPCFSQEPVAKLLRKTARKKWRLIAITLGSSLVEAFSEGASLAIVFMAIQVLSAPVDTPFNWLSNPLVAWWPAAILWLNSLPATSLFMSLLALAVLLQALQSFSRYLNKLSVAYFAAHCRAVVTARIHSQVLSFSFPCASAYKVGDLTSHAATGPEALRQQVEQVSSLLVSVLLIATYLSVLVGLSPWLLLAVVMIGGLITLLQKRLLPRIRAGSKGVMEVQVAITSRITEDFQGLRLLHTSGLLDLADKRLRSRMSELEHQLRAQGRRLAIVEPFSSFLPILAIALIAGLSLFLLGGRSTGVIPSLVTFVLALQRLNTRLTSFAATFNQLADNRGRLDRLNQILTSEGKQFRRLGGIPFQGLQRGIEFDRVSLEYSPTLPPALSNISFTLPKGQMLALVGPSGAGKSSIADLLTGLYAATSGQILIDGTPLDQFDLSAWQRRLGVVSQDTILFNASISDNIALGSPGVTKGQIQEACRDAQAAKFIESLPHGYNTMVGERGYRLSGGQRQRLSLARAILRDPDLLILDEATSALDSQSERLVQQAIERFGRDHTLLVIAHRLSTIQHADQIYVLENGRMAQYGTHESLIAIEQGLYATSWRQQSSRLIST